MQTDLGVDLGGPRREVHRELTDYLADQGNTLLVVINHLAAEVSPPPAPPLPSRALSPGPPHDSLVCAAYTRQLLSLTAADG